MNDLQAALARVGELLDRATPGEWEQAHRRSASDGYSTEVYDTKGAVIATLAWHAVKVNEATTTTDREANAIAICAAINLLRQHLPELQACVRDAGRLDALEFALSEDYHDIDFCTEPGCRCGGCKVFVIKDIDEATVATGETLRAAIDAAIEEGGHG